MTDFLRVHTLQCCWPSSDDDSTDKDVLVEIWKSGSTTVYNTMVNSANDDKETSSNEKKTSFGFVARRYGSSLRTVDSRMGLGSSDGSKPGQFTLAVLGAPKVGKTALVSQFLWGTFIQEYSPTVEEFNWIEYDLGDGIEFTLKIIDTSGSRDFLAMRNLYIKTVDALMLVFAIDDTQSFEEAKLILDEIERYNVHKIPVVLLANKIDLFDDDDNWLVSTKDIERLVEKSNCTFRTVSAKESSTVQDVFRETIVQWVEPSNGSISTLKKRRQSMPVVYNRNRGVGGLDPKDFARIVGAAEKNDQNNKERSSCVLS